VETRVHQEIVERDYAARYPLFGDILLGITDVPEMPLELQPFDREITMSEARAEARAVWQLMALPEHDQNRSMRTEASIRCSDPNLIAAFFPEFPLEEDFAEGTASIEYEAELVAAKIDNARAKQACADCPMRQQCLTRSIQGELKLIGRADQRLVHGVAGGWEPADRIVIVNRLKELLREPRRR
jgi:hypothetical protein